MTEIKFSCKDCVFAEYVSFKGKDIQYDCKLKRVDKLSKDRTSEENDNVSYFVFDRFCNTRRPVEWLEQYCENDINLGITEVYKEVAPRLSIIIKFNHDMNLLKQNLQSIYDQMDSRKFVIIINEKSEYNMEIFQILEDLYQHNKIVQYNILMPPSSLEYIYDTIDDALDFCKNGWIVFLDEGDTIPTNLTEKIDHRINHEMRRFVYCKKDNKSFIIQSAVYKLIGGNSPKILSDGTVDSRTFLDRIESLEATDPDCICNWGDIFNE